MTPGNDHNERRMMAIDVMAVIRHYYSEDNDLRRLLLLHSRQVAERSLRVADAHPELGLDCTLLEQGAMLHDIGICQTDAPGICCHGTQPYICHGTLGAAMLRSLVGSTLDGQLPAPLTSEQLEPLARICERHTGTGITPEQIERQHLPLPADRCLQPITLEEQVVCYADKFYSKSHPERERTIPQTADSLRKFGDECVQRFLQWSTIFE